MVKFSGPTGQIAKSMALAFFASALADLREEQGAPMSGEIMDQLPDEIDPAAIHAADTLIMGLLSKFEFDKPDLSDSQKLALIYMKAANIFNEDSRGSDRELNPDNFGHYLAMQAMGHGVGLESFGSAVHDAIPVPYVEFGSHSLEKDYPVEGEE